MSLYIFIMNLVHEVHMKKIEKKRSKLTGTQKLSRHSPQKLSRHSPFAANVVPKLVSMATSLRPSISAMTSLDSLIPKIYPLESNTMSLAAPSMFGMHVLTLPQIDLVF